MESNHETLELLRRGVSAVERLAPAMERLAEEPEIKVPAFPAVCPHCEQMNPIVQVEESESTGKLGEFVIRGKCLMCNHLFYALPMQWICVTTLEEAKQAAQERAEISGYGNDS